VSFIVAVLGGQGEPLQDLAVGRLKLGGAVADALLQQLVVPVKFQVQPSGLQQVADAQQHLGGVEGLDQEIGGPIGQGPLLGLGRDVGGQHQDRQEGPGGNHLAELGHDREPVQVGHGQVKQDQVRVVLGVQGQHLTGVGGGDVVGVAGVVQDAFEQQHIGRFVVHDEDADLAWGWPHATNAPPGRAHPGSRGAGRRPAVWSGTGSRRRQATAGSVRRWHRR
jgi:hypothetical protein